MEKLPNEIVLNIYEYDGRYHANYKNILKQIINLNNWKKFERNHIKELLEVNQWIMSIDEKCFYLNILDNYNKYDFYYYYFKKFHKFNLKC